MQRIIQRLMVISLIALFLLNGCVNIVVEDEMEKAVAPDLGATAEALLEQGQGQVVQAPVATDLPASPQPVPTATRYVPEGELAYFNFVDLAEGWAAERAPGITVRNPGTYGIEISHDSNKDYFLSAGVQGHPDGNVSTYVLNVTPPEETMAFVACRVTQEASNVTDYDQTTKDAYIAQFRLDGAARLLKKVDRRDTVLADWVTGIGVNPEGVYNQLYLLCDGQRLLFMVNAQVVFDLQDNALNEGDFAIGVAHNPSGAETVIRFDKVAVFEP